MDSNTPHAAGKNIGPFEGGKDCILPAFLPNAAGKKCVAIGRALSQSSYRENGKNPILHLIS
jgi:hypothetical protein